MDHSFYVEYDNWRPSIKFDGYCGLADLKYWKVHNDIDSGTFALEDSGRRIPWWKFLFSAPQYEAAIELRRIIRHANQPATTQYDMQLAPNYMVRYLIDKKGDITYSRVLPLYCSQP